MYFLIRYHFLVCLESLPSEINITKIILDVFMMLLFHFEGKDMIDPARIPLP
jgi:hypothetical protein